MKNHFIYMFLVALIFAGCTEDEKKTGLDDQVPVGINAGISTRVKGTQWENGDVIGLYMTVAGVNNIAEGVSNYPYETTGDGSFEPADTKKRAFYPVDGSRVDLYAYYPWASALSGSTLPVDVSDQSDPDIDLLTAHSDGHSNRLTDVSFTFRHRLARLSFTLDNSVSKVTIAGAVITVKSIYLQADYDLIDDKLTPKGTRTDINVPEADGKYSVILLPGTVEAGVEFLVTLADGSTFTAVPATGSEFKAGVNNKFTLRLSAQPVQVSATIADWDDETIPPIGADAVVPEADDSQGFTDGKTLAIYTSGQSLAKYTYNSATKKWNTGNPLSWRYDSPTMDFHAIYPYSTALPADANAMLIDLTNQSAGTTNLEYMAARKTVPAADMKLKLDFGYILTMLELRIIIKPENGEIIDASDLTMTVNGIHTTGFYKLDANNATNALTRNTTTGIITLPVKENTDPDIQADFIAYSIVFPGTTATGMKIILTANGITYEAPINMNYDAGKNYIHELTLQNGKITLSATMPGEWEPGGTHKGEFN